MPKQQTQPKKSPSKKMTGNIMNNQVLMDRKRKMESLYPIHQQNPQDHHKKVKNNDDDNDDNGGDDDDDDDDEGDDDKAESKDDDDELTEDDVSVASET